MSSVESLLSNTYTVALSCRGMIGLDFHSYDQSDEVRRVELPTCYAYLRPSIRPGERAGRSNHSRHS